MKKVISLLLTLALGAACIAGCTSESGESSTSPSESSAKDGLTKVTFVSPTALESYDYLAIYVGKYLGYFEDEGLDVELVEQTGTDDMKMLASGTAQFAYPSPGVMWSCIDAGITDVQAICNYDSIMIFGIAVNADAGIESFSDLKGKDVALATESWSSLLAPILNGAGMETTDVNLVTYGDGRYEAVASGSAPALGTWLSEYCQLVGQGYNFEYLDGNTVAPQVSNSLCTSKTFMESDPETVQKFVNAFTKSMYFCYCNPEAAADITLLTCPNLEIEWEGALGAAEGDIKQIFGITEEDMEKTIEYGIGKFDDTLCQNAVDHLYEAGTISNQYTATDYYTNEFVDEISWSKEDVEADAAEYECSSKQYLESAESSEKSA